MKTLTGTNDRRRLSWLFALCGISCVPTHATGAVYQVCREFSASSESQLLIVDEVSPQPGVVIAHAESGVRVEPEPASATQPIVTIRPKNRPAGPVAVIYTMDGSPVVNGRYGTDRRADLMSGLPPLLRWGFKTVVVPTYWGAVTAEYFAPLKAEAAKYGAEVVAAAAVTDVPMIVYGEPYSTKWIALSREKHGLSPTETRVFNTHHYMITLGWLDWRCWEELYGQAVAAKAATGSQFVYFDWEFVWWAGAQTKYDQNGKVVRPPLPELMSETNRKVVRGHLAIFLSKLRQAGITPIFYHPHPAGPTTRAYNEVASPLLFTIGNNAVHFSPLTYFNQSRVTYTLPSVASANSDYLSFGITNQFHGYCHYLHSGYGWTPADFAAEIDRQGVANNCWLFFGAPKAKRVGEEFAALTPRT